MRIGIGYDVHQFSDNRELILGGVTVPHPKGLLGHSDADVLTHAIIDALLGALALGNIGDHFPDTDPQYKDVSSIKLLHHVCVLIKEKDYTISNIDSTVVAEQPKLRSHIPEIRSSLAKALAISIDQISVKATTSETLGFEGRMEGMSVQSVALLQKN
ncbi:MAG: 2-C-methyl-D-erythritol 2,4-cyclodiphosphate synthase [Candidatus Marinamargulisbacteria bacterium]|jgi:2-C-methyl-D-erythritol 2,4-cyclodiphosphate synthase